MERFEESFDGLVVDVLAVGAAAFPEAEGVVELRLGVVRFELGVALEATDDVVDLRGGAEVGLGEEEVAARVARVEVGGSRSACTASSYSPRDTAPCPGRSIDGRIAGSAVCRL